MVTLSVLDQSPVAAGKTPNEAFADTARLAMEVETLGYKRFWVSEHHNTLSLAGSSPEILISHLAARTKHLRIGSGGVMLPHYSSYKVAENFRVLEALYPERIDLGLGRAPGGHPIATWALQDGKNISFEHYPVQIDELIGYLYDTLPVGHRFKNLKATPIPSTVPDMWLLGSSGESAGLAAERGAGFAFAQFINGDGGADVVRDYQTRFQATVVGNKPRSIAAIFAICADTDGEAERLAASLDLILLLHEQGKRPDAVPSVQEALEFPYTAFDRKRILENRKRMIVGSPTSVKQQILSMAKEYNTDEWMIVTTTHDFAAKLHSYRLLAEAFQLPIS
ncbi:LLM class flavin-dependent oxidoreductase [Fodinisporobacter ferrooxydans]|uniref:LLM class flavin-dependent oxidoreductase n=1 Tax=Fodinisporobacter ferrooxydans TaxID=2901836 RepID=A0ABY4CG24_9BACL|nr:LLM class flavin-dependent oxidoreductase [Alicyclobacillaceae bacterium MYW30-H2]